MNCPTENTKTELASNTNDIGMIGACASQTNTISDFIQFSRNIFDSLHRANTRENFLRFIMGNLMGYIGCDVAEMVIEKMEQIYYGKLQSDSKQPFIFKCHRWNGDNISDADIESFQLDEPFKLLCNGTQDISCFGFTKCEDFWLSENLDGGNFNGPEQSVATSQGYQSIIIIPIIFGERCIGWIQMKSLQTKFFSLKAPDVYRGIMCVLGLSASYQGTQSKLKERVKELSCLHAIAKIVNEPDTSLPQILDDIVSILPSALLYPESASACITFKGEIHATENFKSNANMLSADIVLNEGCCGEVVVAYTDTRPERYEGPFLREERNLINAVAREVSLIIERYETKKKQLEIKEQLQHADRLATIGQLSAGVAHEFNEPLGNILGYAQLIHKSQDLPKQVMKDAEKIINASLHAREIVKKLLVFARQNLPQTASVDINQVVEEYLYFLESRCAKEGIKLTKILDPSLPEINADSAQVHQILVNLMVNALQATSKDGTLTVSTSQRNGGVILAVRDTGIGMDEDIQKKIFLPFFTTKDVGQGTGLGLSVVHGIVSSHGGTIRVDSKPGKGSLFEIWLPLKGLSNEQKELLNVQE